MYLLGKKNEVCVFIYYWYCVILFIYTYGYRVLHKYILNCNVGFCVNKTNIFQKYQLLCVIIVRTWVNYRLKHVRNLREYGPRCVSNYEIKTPNIRIVDHRKVHLPACVGRLSQLIKSLSFKVYDCINLALAAQSRILTHRANPSARKTACVLVRVHAYLVDERDIREAISGISTYTSPFRVSGQRSHDRGQMDGDGPMA